MLTKLRLKNWRSVKNAEIDLAPITVFIGANSSGKTNILDALRFLQDIRKESNGGIVGSVRYKWGGREKLRTIGSKEDECTQIEFSFQPNPHAELLTQSSSILFYNTEVPLLKYTSTLTYGTEVIEDSAKELPYPPNYISETEFFEGNGLSRGYAIKGYLDTFITYRWQIFKEMFMPQTVLPAGENDPGNLYVVEESGRNIAFMLDYMRSGHPNIYEQLQDDIFWLLNHIERLETKHTDRELSLLVREKAHKGLEAPSISAGTSRLIAMLTAFYALQADPRKVKAPLAGDFPESKQWIVPAKDMPGLVVIEEPDTALNPGILRNFVEQLRVYTEGDAPRQFILTTHNPRFLDYFRPEEVRVVSRDEQGYTTVSGIPKHIPEVWLEEGYSLGEVWMTHSLGGLPE